MILLANSVGPSAHGRLVERLNDEFSDILESGKISKTEVHRLEADDEHLRDLPRLAFHFDRKSFGRLRQMIDLINRELGEEPAPQT